MLYRPSIPVVCFIGVRAAVLAYQFQPDNHTTWRNSRVPSLIDLSADQDSGSYWSSAFVTATTGQQFVLIHHQAAQDCKSSVLDLHTLKYWQNVDFCVVTNETKRVSSESLSIRFPTFSISSDTADKISELHLFAESPSYSFNLTIEAKSSKVLLNGGNGVIPWGHGFANSTHWSIPAGRTSGTLTLGTSEPLKLDEKRSFTWYDHQVVQGAPENFTFFELHFPNPDIRMSIWAYDWPDSSDQWRFATVRLDQEAMMVLPLTLVTDWANSWVSPKSNRTYPQSWTAKFDNGDYLRIDSVKDDQEIKDGAWTGFVTVTDSRFLGQSSGFGVGDTVYLD